MANEPSWRLQSFSAADIETAMRILPVLGAKMEQIKVEFLDDANAAEQNQQLMDIIVQHCRKKLSLFHMIGFTPNITLSTQMPSVEYLLIRDSEFGRKNTNLSDLFPNVQYLELHNISGTPAILGNLLKESFHHLRCLWLDYSKNFNNRIVRTFLERNTNVTKLILEFGAKGMTKHFFLGIDKEMRKLQNLTIVPALPPIPAHQQTFTFQPLLFQELQELNIHGYYDSNFDLISYLSISNENVIRMNIEASDLNSVTMRGISFYIFLRELTISADKGLNFENLIALVENLTGLQKIQIIRTGNSDDLRNVDKFLDFIRRFGRMNEFILKDSLSLDYVGALRNRLDNAVWTIQHRNFGIRVHKTHNIE